MGLYTPRHEILPRARLNSDRFLLFGWGLTLAACLPVAPRVGAPQAACKVPPKENLTTASHHRILPELQLCLPSKQLHTLELAPRIVLLPPIPRPCSKLLTESKHRPRNGSQGRRAECLLGDSVHSDDASCILESPSTSSTRSRRTQETSHSCESVNTKLRDPRAASGTITGGARESKDCQDIPVRPADREVEALLRLGAQDHGDEPGGADGYAPGCQQLPCLRMSTMLTACHLDSRRRSPHSIHSIRHAPVQPQAQGRVHRSPTKNVGRQSGGGTPGIHEGRRDGRASLAGGGGQCSRGRRGRRVQAAQHIERAEADPERRGVAGTNPASVRGDGGSIERGQVVRAVWVVLFKEGNSGHDRQQWCAAHARG